MNRTKINGYAIFFSFLLHLIFFAFLLNINLRKVEPRPDNFVILMEAGGSRGPAKVENNLITSEVESKQIKNPEIRQKVLDRKTEIETGKIIKNQVTENQKAASEGSGTGFGTGTGSGFGSGTEPGIGIPEHLLNPKKREDDLTYYIAVEEMPEPIGGENSISARVVYPERAKAAGVDGLVYVQAFIDENGRVRNALIIKGIGYGCDEAVIAAVKRTRFKPGRKKDNYVKVQMTIQVECK